MTRLRTASALTALLAVLAVVTATAHAKEVMSLQACGADGCSDVVESETLGHVALEGGPRVAAPERAAPFLRLRYGVGDGTRLMERFTTTFIPASGLLRTEGGEWMRLHPEETALLRRLTRGVAPFPADRLELPAPLRSSARDRAPVVAGDDGLPGWLLPVGVALLAAAALVPLARVRREPAG